MMRFLPACAMILLLSGLTSCRDASIPSSLSRDREIGEFLEIARGAGNDAQIRYAALEPVISRYRDAGELDRLTSLLSEFLELNPGDPYGAYYLLAMAEGAKQNGSEELSLDYLRRLNKNYPDMTIKGESLHLMALSEIASRTTHPREAVTARVEMEQRFPDRIDRGLNAYNLAGAYGAVGDWNAMYDAFEEFLGYPDTVVPGHADAWNHIQESVGFNRSDKSWTVENLDELVANLKYALRNRNAALMDRYRARNFFLMNWSQESSDSFTHIPMDLGSLLKGNITYRRNLEDFSNENEAFLWTTGWSWKIHTWYFYFRKVDYPADPEINGRWEWAGIYIGERL